MRYVIALLVAAFAVSACGDDDDTTSPPAVASPTADAQGTAPAGQPAEQLLYVRDDQSVWLYDTSTEIQRQFIPSGLCETWFSAEWNFDGTKPAMTCGTSPGNDVFSVFVFDAAGTELDRLSGYRLAGWSPSSKLLLLFDESVDEQGVSHDALVIYDADAGERAQRIEIPDASAGSFSPDGTSLAYFRADAACAPACETGLIVRTIDDGAERSYGNLVPMVWVLGGDAIVAQSSQVCSGAAGCDAYLVDLESGDQTPVPALNGYTQYWASPDGYSVVYLSRREDGLGLAVLDVTTLATTEIAGSTISYPSDHIPQQHVALTDKVFWFDATGSGSPWFSANYDGTGLTQLGEAQSYFLQFSPSRSFVAYPTADPVSGAKSMMLVARIDGSQMIELGPSGYAMSWRPTGD